MTGLAVLLCGCATAQSRIDRIVDELEEKGVNMSKVVKRDPKTKQVYSIVKTFTFYSKDGKYARRLKEAFAQDAENAVSEVVNNYGNNSVLVFRDGRRKATYTLNIVDDKGKDPRVNVTIIIKDGSVKASDDWSSILFDSDPLLPDSISGRSVSDRLEKLRHLFRQRSSPVRIERIVLSGQGETALRAKGAGIGGMS